MHTFFQDQDRNGPLQYSLALIAKQPIQHAAQGSVNHQAGPLASLPPQAYPVGHSLETYYNRDPASSTQRLHLSDASVIGIIPAANIIASSAYKDGAGENKSLHADPAVETDTTRKRLHSGIESSRNGSWPSGRVEEDDSNDNGATDKRARTTDAPKTREAQPHHITPHTDILAHCTAYRYTCPWSFPAVNHIHLHSNANKNLASDARAHAIASIYASF
jgi:hypothetical protein